MQLERALECGRRRKHEKKKERASNILREVEDANAFGTKRLI